MSPRIAAIYMVVVVPVVAARADVMTAMSLLQSQERWKVWAAEEKKIQVTGRYWGRTASQIRMQKLDIVFIPEKGVRVPERIRLGTPLAVSGYFVNGKRRPQFLMTGLIIEPSDVEQMEQQLKKIPETKAKARYNLANDYDVIATFYSDRELQAAVERCRTMTFDSQRQRHQNDPEALWTLVDPGPGIEISQQIQQDIRFRVFCLRAADDSDLSVLEDLKGDLKGWNIPAQTINESLLSAFEANQSLAYEKADEPQRRQLERLLYRQVRLREFRSTLKTDNSNALTVAVNVYEELPEEITAIRMLKSAGADYRLKDIRNLKRRQLDATIDLLCEIGRDEDAQKAAKTWLDKQESVVRTDRLDGQLRLAGDFLHASTQWNLSEYKKWGIEYLKRAWTSASHESPIVAKEIEQRLEQLGFTRLHQRWHISDDLEQLPQSDIELALREERIVRGMSSAQVEGILGSPTRRIRMASLSSIEDVWVYGERWSSRMIVRFRRPTANSDDSAKVIGIRQIRGR
ncbi:MAG: hypothetical protein MK102_08095 [Fuerstiella sp.]|nr:hypothetical protein [Fuerstiella sp.]